MTKAQDLWVGDLKVCCTAMSPHCEILEKCEVSVLEADSWIFSGPIDTQGKIEKR